MEVSIGAGGSVRSAPGFGSETGTGGAGGCTGASGDTAGLAPEDADLRAVPRLRRFFAPVRPFFDGVFRVPLLGAAACVVSAGLLGASLPGSRSRSDRMGSPIEPLIRWLQV